MDESLLAKLQTPAQYIGGEYNSIVKDWRQARVKMAFCFPDTYEIGMSHLGLRLLYEAVNREEHLLLERCFAPMEDLRQFLLASGEPLCALESGRALADFDVLGFTLQYELTYTNVLDMLHLAKLPLFSKQRDGWPLIIAGGPCAFNPEPLSDFIDLFCLGESESQLLALLKLVAHIKEQGLHKRDFLSEAIKLPGVYVPEFYQPQYSADGRFVSLAPLNKAPPRIPKTLMRELDSAPFPSAPLLPHTQVVHDRIMLELMRGCTRGCRFCQSGVIYRPLREKQPPLLLEQARVLAENSGYEDIGLISLSSADYSEISPLLRELIARHGGCGMGLSLPSLRVDAFSVGLANAAGQVRKSGLTFAPEAGSQRLRDIINKGVTSEDITDALTAAFSQGYSKIKLYFMIGLPYETAEDIAAIASLSLEIISLYRKFKPAYVKKPLSLSLSLASFVPKAHTPFQWHGQDNSESLRAKQAQLRQLLRPLKQVSLRYHDAEASLLEAAFARGDRRLGAVLHRAWQMGCHADGWSEHFQMQSWREAFAACGLSPQEYACRHFSFDEPLPWQHLESGVDKAWLWQEYQKAAAGISTADCRGGQCTKCGVCPALGCRVQLALPLAETSAAATMPASCGAPTEERWRLRLQISGPARWFSQLNLLAALEKAVRRSGLPIAFSQGFNPHMLISWGPAHPVGLGGNSEYADLTFAAALPQTWTDSLQAVLPPGMRLLAASPIKAAAPALMAAIDRADYQLKLVGELDGAQTDKAIEAFMAGASYVVERRSPKGLKKLDIRPCLLSLTRVENTLYYSCRLQAGAQIKPQELARIAAPGASAADYRRIAMYIADKEPLPL